MFIDGIGISSYRSFGSKLQKIGPFSKINLLVGQNNAGKSNILSFLFNHYQDFLKSARGQGTKPKFSSLDLHLGEGKDNGTIRVAFAIKLDGHKYQELLEEHKINKISS